MMHEHVGSIGHCTDKQSECVNVQATSTTAQTKNLHEQIGSIDHCTDKGSCEHGGLEGVYYT
jgi:hypothetical protein